MHKVCEDAKLSFCVGGVDVRKCFGLTEGKVPGVGVEPTRIGAQVSNDGRWWEMVPTPPLGYRAIAADQEKTVRGHLPNRPLQQGLVSIRRHALLFRQSVDCIQNSRDLTLQQLKYLLALRATCEFDEFTDVHHPEATSRPLDQSV